MADQFTPNYRRSPTFARPAVDSTRWANAPDLVSVISCTSNRFPESCVASCTADDRAEDHDRGVRHAESAHDRRAVRRVVRLVAVAHRNAVIAVDRDRRRDERNVSETDREESSRQRVAGSVTSDINIMWLTNCADMWPSWLVAPTSCDIMWHCSESHRHHVAGSMATLTASSSKLSNELLNPNFSSYTHNELSFHHRFVYKTQLTLINWLSSRPF